MILSDSFSNIIGMHAEMIHGFPSRQADHQSQTDDAKPHRSA
jgi:hypothetical protein